jgi:hypothetical protein
MVRSLRWVLAGFGYGVLLFFFGFICAGAGHGSYLPLAVFGAPLSLLDPAAGLFAGPVLWLVCGVLFGLPARRGWIVALLALHLMGVGAVLWFGNRFEGVKEQWESFGTAREFVPAALWGGLLVYVAGQVVAWKAALSQGRAWVGP